MSFGTKYVYYVQDVLKVCKNLDKRTSKSNKNYIRNLFFAFEHCPSLTFHLVGGEPFGLWPVLLLKDGGKLTDMTATQHLATLGKQFPKMMLALFFLHL
jgi:hypothetical protein